MNVLYTWVGKSDLKAPQPGNKAGPIADALRGLSEENKGEWRVVLLQDCDRSENNSEGERYCSWLKKEFGEQRQKIKITLHLEQIDKTKPGDDPTSYLWVYDKMRERIGKHDQEIPKPFSRHYLVGPGTPTMAACTIIFSRLKNYQGSLWLSDVRSERGYGKLELPFDLSLEEAPDPQSEWKEPVSENIVRSPSTVHAWELATRAANSAFPVLILGNTGTGKEEIAKHIHQDSQRTGSGFVPINCGAIPPDLVASELFGHVKGAFTGAVQDKAGAFEAAQGGTIFLDEIGELPLAAQIALLRVLQTKTIRRVGASEERPVDFRVIAATHRNLWQMVQDGKFREDLYYRLACIIIKLEDLKDRQEDLVVMIERFWKSVTQENKGFPGRDISEGAHQRLLEHQWPGNIRELKSALTRMAFLARKQSVGRDIANEAITQGAEPHSTGVDQADPSMCSNPAFKTLVDLDGNTWNEKMVNYRRCLIEAELQKTGGNKSQAAKNLGITPQHLAKVFKRHP